MRKPAAVMAATLLSLTLAGCFGGTTGAEQSAPPQQSSGPVEIRFMIGQPEDAADLKLVKEDIKNFESKNPGITEITIIPNRGHSLTIDHGWAEVAQISLDFVTRVGALAVSS